ncbi:MAG: hypothetical protein ABI606_15270 [Rhodoferax sp.]
MFNSNLSATVSLSRLAAMKRYLIWTSLLNFGWEVLQLPLYTIWVESSGREIAFAVVHCTVGDAMITTISLVASVILVGKTEWPNRRYWVVALTVILLGLGYTIYSEWNNTVVTRNWAYAAAMPQIWGIGLSPIAQWIIIPSFAFWRLYPPKASLNTRL